MDTVLAEEVHDRLMADARSGRTMDVAVDSLTILSFNQNEGIDLSSSEIIVLGLK
jgi:hypothetical protein